MNGNAKCAICSKTVYAMERMDADGMTFHKTCMKCKECNCTLKLGNYASLAGDYFCKAHYKQLFKLKGNYDDGFGREQPKMKWQKEGLGYGSGSKSMRMTSSAPVSPVSSPVAERRQVAELPPRTSRLAQQLAESKTPKEEGEVNEEREAFEEERRKFEEEKREFEERVRQFEEERELLALSVVQLETEKRDFENIRTEQLAA